MMNEAELRREFERCAAEINARPDLRPPEAAEFATGALVVVLLVGAAALGIGLLCLGLWL